MAIERLSPSLICRVLMSVWAMAACGGGQDTQEAQDRGPDGMADDAPGRDLPMPTPRDSAAPQDVRFQREDGDGGFDRDPRPADARQEADARWPEPYPLSAAELPPVPAGCDIRVDRELFIRHPSVLRDPVRTAFKAPVTADTGAWTLKRVLQNAASSPGAALELLDSLFAEMVAPTLIAPGVPRSRFRDAATLSREMAGWRATWPKTKDGVLDLERLPARLIAIVNRIDLRRPGHGAGEGRLLFQLPPHPAGMFFLSFEYELAAESDAEVESWARRFHALGALDPAAPEYRAALARLVDGFAGRGRGGSMRTNGSSLLRVALEDDAFDKPWTMKQFALDPSTGRFVQTLLDGTVDGPADVLMRMANAYAPDILNGTFTPPDTFEGVNVRRAVVSSLIDPKLPRSPLFDRLAMGNCAHCHGVSTGSPLFHAGFSSEAEEEPTLSTYLIGDAPGGRKSRPLWMEFRELERRRRDLATLVCGAGGFPAP